MLNRFRYLLGLVTAFLSLGFSSLVYSECSLRAAWEPWEPYQYEENGKPTGLDNDLIKAIIENAGCSVTFHKRPWTRALKEIKSGDMDVAPAASITAERSLYANFSETYRDETIILVVQKGSSSKYPMSNIKDVTKSDFRLGVVRDFYYGDGFKDAMKDPAFSKKVTDVISNENNLKKLTNGRIEGILGDKYSIIYVAKKSGAFDKLEVHPMSVNSDAVFLMFSKKTVGQETIDKINKSLKELRDNGTYDKIINKYLK